MWLLGLDSGWELELVFELWIWGTSHGMEVCVLAYLGGSADLVFGTVGVWS